MDHEGPTYLSDLRSSSMQYTVLCLNGERFSAMINDLRSATIVTILEKYQSLLMSQSWNTLFFPSDILEVLCRRERGQQLTPAAEKQCEEVTQVLLDTCETLNFAIRRDLLRHDEKRSYHSHWHQVLRS